MPSKSVPSNLPDHSDGENVVLIASSLRVAASFVDSNMSSLTGMENL